jgi:hypothetical protein
MTRTTQQAFFPKNRNLWKQYSSWEPEEKIKGSGRGGRMVDGTTTRFPADVQVKKGYSWSEQLGIAIAALVEGGGRGLVDWVRDVRGSLLLLFLEGVLIIGPWVDIDFGHCTTTAAD